MRLRKKLVLSLALLVVLAAAGLLFGTAGFRPKPQSAEAALMTEVKKLLASDAQADDEFGFSVAVSGNIAVVGAFLEDAEGTNAGAAYLFKRDEGGADTWGELTKLTVGDADADDLFGISVAIDGDIIIVGANKEDAGGSGAGAAYIFERDQGGPDSWGEVKKLTASDADIADQFGRSVSVSGDTVLVGAWFEDSTAFNAGAAYVFQRNEGGADNWGEVNQLLASDGANNDYFGWTVSVNGDTAIIGSYLNDEVDSDAGGAFVFQRDQGGADNWGQVIKLTASDAQADDYFGWSVSVSGDTAVVGALLEDAAADDAGAAYIFQRNEGGVDNWGEVKKLLASDAETDDNFGIGVSVNGNTAVVGAYLEDAEGTNAGAAYLFERDEGGANNWGEFTKLLASEAQADDNFGVSVGVSGDTIVGGAWFEDAGGDAAGAAYVFDLQHPKKLAEPGDTDGDGCSDQREFGPDETLGGRRSYKDPYDFYDVLGPGAALPKDKIIDLPNDILGVIQHFAPLGTEPEYDVQFDRGPSAGPNPWNMTAPDGVIDLPNDILGVIQQFAHSCQ